MLTISHINFSRCLRNIAKEFTLEVRGFWLSSIFYVWNKKIIDDCINGSGKMEASQIWAHSLLFKAEQHRSARTTLLRSYYVWFSFLIQVVGLPFFRHAVLSWIINRQARRVNVTDNTTCSQPAKIVLFFSARFGGGGGLGGRVY